ncbi:MAG: glutathione S-transferase family protein [Proteobacteria bacterium]|nr:glutathione S-transferase family protein [Pseudomonadota bacterium]
MIKLYQFPPAFGLINAGAFCAKVETYLRMTGIDYDVVAMADPRKAPKGKLPYIEDDGEIIADSTIIIEHLKKKYGDALNEGLPVRAATVAHAFKRMLDENLYFTVLYCRWVDPKFWPITRERFKPMMPAVIGGMVLDSLRKGMVKMLKGQGIARHSRDEAYAIGNRDLDAVSEFLGDKPFFHGDKPRDTDAWLYGHLIQIIAAPHDSPMKAHAATLPNLAEYCERMKDRFFGEE